MTIEEVDRTLQRLRDSAQMVSANLLELELDPHRRLLDESNLRGQSEQRWAQATATLSRLWQSYALLDDLLERASEMRRARSWLAGTPVAELESLLTGRSIELEEHAIPIEQRGLLDGPSRTLRCTPDELLQRMSEGFDQTKGEIATFGRAWDEALPRVRELRRTIDRCAEVSQTVGDTPPPELERIRARLTTLSQSLAHDPLSVADAELEALEASEQSLRRELDAIAQTRRGMDELLLQGRGLLDQLRDAVRAGSEAHRETQLKIADPDVPDPVAFDGDLERQLASVGELAQRGAWREAQRALDQWTTRARAMLEQARTVAGQNRAPLAERNELRGLLEAYQAKAQRLGLTEDLELVEHYDRAHAALHAAPTDLRRAAELVRSYQQAIPDSHSSRTVLP